MASQERISRVFIPPAFGVGAVWDERCFRWWQEGRKSAGTEGGWMVWRGGEWMSEDPEWGLKKEKKGFIFLPNTTGFLSWARPTVVRFHFSSFFLSVKTRTSEHHRSRTGAFVSVCLFCNLCAWLAVRFGLNVSPFFFLPFADPYPLFLFSNKVLSKMNK